MKLWILSTILLAASCDSGKEAAEKRAQEEAAKQAEAEKAAAARKAERDAEAEREAKAEADRQAALDELVGLPQPLPNNLDKACKAMLAAYDTYMRSVLTGDLKTKWETGGNEMQLKLFGTECRKRTVEVAACQTYALGKMKPEHEKDMGEIFTRCVQKFGATSG